MIAPSPHAHLPIRLQKYDAKPKFVRFGGGGRSIDFTRGHYQTGGHQTPEDFFEPWKWWNDDYRTAEDPKVWEGVPYVDMRAAVETSEGYAMAIRGPMLNVDLEPGDISRLSDRVDATALQLMAPAIAGNQFGMLLALHLAHPGPMPGPLDYVSIPHYCALWKAAGATVGVIHKGQFVPAA